MENKIDYFNRAQKAQEMKRLIEQSDLFDSQVGGMLDVFSPSERDQIQSIVDLGCGPAGTLRKAAREYPDKQFLGVDNAPDMLDFARAETMTSKITNVEFLAADLRKLPFPLRTQSFDLVYARLVFGFLQRNFYPYFVEEMVRILRPGGWVLWWDCDFSPFTSSPSLAKLYSLGKLAFFRSGVGHQIDALHITSPLLGIFQGAGLEEVRQRIQIIDCSYGTSFTEACFRDNKDLFSQLKGYCQKMGVVNEAPHKELEVTEEEYDYLVSRLDEEMHRQDFVVRFVFIATIGRKPAI
uniref:Methyltransferase domain-containing protein n=1 Tax=Thermosporothrix sp. COM3 TaxID=2490863 RepID=A0A455SIJ2_9CHLR|nr:hypothetical protein KTC_19390 [Thermosporothrix sp. COM3]